MIAEYGWSIVISVYLVYAIGITGLTLVFLTLLDKAFSRLLTTVKVYGLFTRFIYEHYRKKRENKRKEGV